MKKTILVTGVTGALGKATTLELAKENCQLILMGRNAEKLTAIKSEIVAATGNKDIDLAVADLSEPQSIKHAAAELRKKYPSLNALVNVAGIYKSKREENSMGLEKMFAGNHLGPFILTNELLDLLKAGRPARIISVAAPSTTKLNFDDLQGRQKFSSFNAFGASKMMNLLFTYALARRLEGNGVVAMTYHPGLMKSTLMREMPGFMNFMLQLLSKKPQVAAKKLSELAIAPQYGNANGKFLRYDGKELKSSTYSYDKQVQEKLWTISEQLIK